MEWVAISDVAPPASVLTAGVDYPRSLAELGAMFPDENARERHLERLRLAGGFACRCCGVIADPWRTSRGRLVCTSCRFETRSRAGTVFDKTRTPLSTWFAAAWLLTTAKNGLSATTLERTLGVSYRTAWAMLQRYRVAMVRAERPRLDGVVEIDETFVGGVRHGQGRGPVGKTPVALGVEQLASGGFGRTRMRVVPAAAEYLVPFVCDTVEPGSKPLTDGARAYDALTTRGYTRAAVSMSASQAPAHEHLPGVHRVASLLKRWLLGTHQGSVDPWHLQSYLEEFTFRWNRRNARYRGLVFHRLLEQAAATGPVTVEDVAFGFHKPPLPEPLGDGPHRVVVLDGSEVVAALLRDHLANDGRFAVLFWHSDPQQVRIRVRQLEPDIVVVDAAHLAAAADLAEACPHAAVVIHDPTGELTPDQGAAVGPFPLTATSYRYDELADEMARVSPYERAPF